MSACGTTAIVTLRDRNRIRGVWLIVEHRNVRERTSRSEHLQNLLATLLRRNHRSYTTAQDNAEPFASIALAQDHITGAIVPFR